MGLISGDSYSSVGFEYAPSGYCRPSAIQPLGMPFPGITYNEPELPNWVGHLLTSYVPGPRYNTDKAVEQDHEYLNNPLLAYVYARGGDRVMGVKRQIQKEFLPNAGKKPSWAPWGSDDSIFSMSFYRHIKTSNNFPHSYMDRYKRLRVIIEFYIYQSHPSS